MYVCMDACMYVCMYVCMSSTVILRLSQVCDNAQEGLNLRTRRRHTHANMAEVKLHARDDINNDIVVDMLKPERKSLR